MASDVEKRACPSCGSPLNIKGDTNAVKCEYCGTFVGLKEGDYDEKEWLYKKYLDRYLQAKTVRDYLSLIPYFKWLGKYKDAGKLSTECENRVRKLKRKEAVLRSLKILIIITVLLAIIVPVICVALSNRARYDISRVETQIVDKRLEQDGYKFYLYLDYRITNNTGATVDYIELTTYIKKGDKSIGTITTEIGDYYSGINLAVGSSVIRETYLVSYSIDYNERVFYELYNNDLSAFVFTYKVTGVKFGDGKYVTAP